MNWDVKKKKVNESVKDLMKPKDIEEIWKKLYKASGKQLSKGLSEFLNASQDDKWWSDRTVLFGILSQVNKEELNLEDFLTVLQKEDNKLAFGMIDILAEMYDKLDEETRMEALQRFRKLL